MNDKALDRVLKLHKPLLDAVIKERHARKCIGWIPFDDNGWIACIQCNLDRQKPAPIMEWE